MVKRKITESRRVYLRLKVAERRRELKLQAIKYKGSKCEKCGYSGCPDALTFHHRNPSQKDFKISSGNTKSWSRLKPEIDKCDLLCQNCHAEEHYRLNEPTREEQRRILDTYKKHSRVRELEKRLRC